MSPDPLLHRPTLLQVACLRQPIAHLNCVPKASEIAADASSAGWDPCCKEWWWIYSFGLCSCGVHASSFTDWVALLCRYADFAGSTINDGFDYTHGRDLWKEKLDYTNSWLSAHISDADALGKPLIVEEFGKAVSAKKVYTGELPHSLQPGAQHYS